MNPPGETEGNYLLEPVPPGARRHWTLLLWTSVGVVTTLVALYVGALLVFVAGFRTALIAGGITCLGVLALGSALGIAACRTGLSSNLLAHRHAFGGTGSLAMSTVLGVMMIGFLAAENVLLYQGISHYLGFSDTIGGRLAVCALLAGLWVLLCGYGMAMIGRFSSVMLLGFLLLVAYLILQLVGAGGGWSTVLAAPPRPSPAQLRALGILTDRDRLLFCVNTLAGSGGALALISADILRYARKPSEAVTVVALGGSMLTVGMVAIGGIILCGAGESASQGGPEAIATQFIAVAGLAGLLLVFAAQSKAQVVNNYSAALALGNIVKVASGARLRFISCAAAAGLLSLTFSIGDSLVWFSRFLSVLGVLTTAFAGVMALDFYASDRSNASWLGRNREWLNLAIVALATAVALLWPAIGFGVQPLAALLTIVAAYGPLLFLRRDVAR